MAKPQRALLLITMALIPVLLLGLTSAAPAGPAAAASAKVVISHRAASGYLPEHTLPAVAMAYAFGPDYIEQDVALTKDGVFVVIHDIYLDATTDVSKVFPDRKRADGRYYVCDFTLAEIKSLRVTERVNASTGVPAFSGRFPVGASKFEMPTLVEEIEMIQGLNKSTGRNIGIYPEIKGPAFHHREGFEIEQMLLDVLAEYGYTSPDANVFVQSFEPDCLVRLRALGCKLRLVQLLPATSGFTAPSPSLSTPASLLTPAGLDYIATYADGIGPSTTQIESSKGDPVDNYSLVRLAHERGLVVHPYTFRRDSMPAVFSSFEEMLLHFFFDIGVDGVFTDFTDIAVNVLKEAGK